MKESLREVRDKTVCSRRSCLIARHGVKGRWCFMTGWGAIVYDTYSHPAPGLSNDPELPTVFLSGSVPSMLEGAVAAPLSKSIHPSMIEVRELYTKSYSS
ncbi:hypothetical protein E2C01_061620 [Portunus trituberculatus]|uniref:Uncharacterized protein n=1 Tax=Portunus trituberculatus TaxID=210409 RepID=A0A5B7HFK6_PORTR|nr:hypothetical protein [Portunus trituberculatus]